jgi:hypothetical protein
MNNGPKPGKQLQSGLIDPTFNDYLRSVDNDSSQSAYDFGYNDVDMIVSDRKANKPIACLETKHWREKDIGTYKGSVALCYQLAKMANLPMWITVTMTKDDLDPESCNFGRPDRMQKRPKVSANPFVIVMPANPKALQVALDCGFVSEAGKGRLCKKRELTQLWRACEGRTVDPWQEYPNGPDVMPSPSQYDRQSIALMCKGLV